MLRVPLHSLTTLDTAGKTSILCHLADVAEANKGIAESVGTAPTVGTQMVEFRRRNTRWIAWDMSGQGACVYVLVDTLCREFILSTPEYLFGSQLFYLFSARC